MEDFIRRVRHHLANGDMTRDDAYHATMQYAATNLVDRYELWRRIQEVS